MTLPTKTATEVVEEGRHARYRGDEEAANPYPPGSPEHGRWLEGYRYPEGREAEEGAPDPA